MKGARRDLEKVVKHLVDPRVSKKKGADAAAQKSVSQTQLDMWEFATAHAKDVPSLWISVGLERAQEQEGEQEGRA
eukprot:4233662-Amphidinium_carterae.1